MIIAFDGTMALLFILSILVVIYEKLIARKKEYLQYNIEEVYKNIFNVDVESYIDEYKEYIDDLPLTDYEMLLLDDRFSRETTDD